MANPGVSGCRDHGLDKHMEVSSTVLVNEHGQVKAAYNLALVSTHTIANTSVLVTCQYSSGLVLVYIGCLNLSVQALILLNSSYRLV